MGDIPDSDIDLFSDAALPDPYPRYRRLRDLGLVVGCSASPAQPIGSPFPTRQ